MNCHWSGTLNKTDQIRDQVLSQPKSYEATVVEFVNAVYVPKAEMNAKLLEDRERFEAAVKRCGLSGLAKSEPVATLAFQFDEPLDLDLAAAEAGVTPERFVTALQTNAALGRELGSLPQGQPVPRDTFVLQFGALVAELKVGTFVPGLTPPQPSTPADITNSIGMKLKLISADEFMMGSPASEEGHESDEGPQHKVRITKSYDMGVTEVTQGQWFAVMKTKPWEGEEYVQEGDDYPAVHVSWDDAIEYCQKLSATEGKSYRLPTEAEWEYACRGGKSTSYSFGSDASGLKNFAWFTENAYDIGEKYAHTVGGKQPNPFGLYDMYGNVYEWCSDWKGDYSAAAATDPVGPSTGSFRVFRGGCWFYSARNCRSAYRNGRVPSLRADLGFRLALSPSGQ